MKPKPVQSITVTATNRQKASIAALLLLITSLLALTLAIPLSAKGITQTPAPGTPAKQAQPALPAAPAGNNSGLPYEVSGARSAAPNNQGGPDAFGYVYDDNQEPGGPVYLWQPGASRVADTAWQKINTGSTASPRDDGVITDTMPFAFSFYGTSYTRIHIGTNGNVHFGLPNDWYPDYNNRVCIPSNSQYVPKAMIAPLWYDFVVPASTDTPAGGVYTSVTGTAPNQTYIVEWRHVTKYAQPSVYATFELLLDQNGTVRYQYQELAGTDTGGAGGVIGIQDATGTVGLTYTCYVNAVIPGRAVRFRVRQAAVITPAQASQGGAPGSVLTYSLTLANQTGQDNSFSIAASGNNWPATVVPTHTGTVLSTASVPVTVTVQIPETAPLNSTDILTLTVSADLPSPGVYTATAQLSSTVSSNGVDFSPQTQTQSGDFNTTVSYNLLFTNTSPTTNSFDITATGNTWPTTLSRTRVPDLAPSTSATVTVAVRIPANAALGDNDVVTIRATGEITTPTRYFGYTVLTTTAGIWNVNSPAPQARSRNAGVLFPPNNKIYSVGGAANGGTAVQIQEYNPDTDSWQNRASLVVPVSNVGAAAIGNVIYIPGGYSSATGGAETVLQVYYPLEDRVAVIPTDPLPVPRLGAGVAAAGGKLYVVGGSDSSLVGTTSLLEFDPALPAGSRWQVRNPMSTPRVYLAAASVDGIVYAAGGMPGAPNDLNTLEAYNPATGAWTTRPSMNIARAGLALVGVDSSQPACGGHLYALGGGWQNYSGTVEAFSTITNTWTVGPSLHDPRRSLGAAYSPSTYSLVTFGGWSGLYESITESAYCRGDLQPPTPTPSPTTCPITFTDVHPTDYFYTAVSYLYCNGVISGYADNTFRPYAYTTRGQLSKIVTLAEGWTINTTGGPHFTDVAVGSAFYAYIETAYNRGVISGYSCGAGCLEFRPNNNITRAQLCKIIVLAEGWLLDTGGGPHFSDVPTSDPFYGYVETAYNHNIISGYAGGFFLPGYPATRGQISKIVYNAVTQP